MKIVGLTHLYCYTWRMDKEHRLCGSFCEKRSNGWQLTSELMNDSKKSLALNLAVGTHKESDSRHVSFCGSEIHSFPLCSAVGWSQEGGCECTPLLSHVWLSRDAAKDMREPDTIYWSFFSSFCSQDGCALPLTSQVVSFLLCLGFWKPL